MQLDLKILAGLRRVLKIKTFVREKWQGEFDWGCKTRRSKARHVIYRLPYISDLGVRADR